MNNNYTVLARKYRPSTIGQLKGQDVLVQTLTHAFESGRIAHAFLLSGARGVGKTSSARIIAKALNCIGPEGKGGITLNPCGVCPHCTSINNDSHLDVTEMDAASNTSVDDIREIIESVKYQPTSARYKIYIIDEVHMLSKSAFNALLKTLEEPPSFAKFIFATTEVKKVPITIISRCQHFFLQRLNQAELAKHLLYVCQKEKITCDPQAAQLLAGAAEGSVRDSLSLLDQAINACNENITEESVLTLLNKSQSGLSFKLFKALCVGADKTALSHLNQIYNQGLEIVTIFEELLEICHVLTLIKTDNHSGSLLGQTLSSTQQENYNRLANEVSLNGLTLLWQMLVKGLEELRLSTNLKRAAEMLIIRITWVHQSIFNTEILRRHLGEEVGKETHPAVPSYSPPNSQATLEEPATSSRAAHMAPMEENPPHPTPAHNPELSTLSSDHQEVSPIQDAIGPPSTAGSLKSSESIIETPQDLLDIFPGSKLVEK